MAASPLIFRFADDGLVPNNPALPFVVYRGALDVSGSRDPAGVIERAFGQNGWGDMWRNGIYPFPHYHSQIHEALGIACGRARVRFGGGAGEELEVEAGDVAVVLINDFLKDGRKTIDIKPWYLVRQDGQWRLLGKYTDFELLEYGFDRARVAEYRRLEEWAERRTPELRREQPDCGC